MTYEQQIERLIRISKEKPLVPDEFIPWHVHPGENDIFLPEQLVSLQGLPVYETLTPAQKKELARHELVQVMYSYAWSETLFCLFMTRYLLQLPPHHIEYRFLLREMIEECRHQEMFSRAVTQLDGQPIRPGFWHNFFGQFTARYLPPDMVFISCLTVEMLADTYGDHLRKNKTVYEVLRKIAELHNIEEARHILFTQLLLEKYTSKAGFFRRSVYSFIVLLNAYFMRTLYVKKEIFERLEAGAAGKLYKPAYRNFKKKFGRECLDTTITFVKNFNGFNGLTRWAWRFLLKVKV